MRKVALITDGWRRLFTYAWPAGILQRIRETGEDVNLYIFNSTGNFYNCVSMGTVILFLYVKESAGMSIAANRMKLNG